MQVWNVSCVKMQLHNHRALKKEMLAKVQMKGISSAWPVQSPASTNPLTVTGLILLKVNTKQVSVPQKN